MAKEPNRPPPRKNGQIARDPVIRLETGDFESLDIDVDDRAPFDSAPQPTKILPDDPQRAVPTHVYNSDALNVPAPDSFNPPLPSDTHPLPVGDATDSGVTKVPERPGPPVPLEPAFLYIDRGPGEGRSVPLPEGELIIGRASTAGLRLSHPSVSREHAVVIRRGERFFVRDAGSHNGTFLNGRQISGQVEVIDNDEIAMGKAVLIVRSGSGAPRQNTVTSVPVTDRPIFKVAIFGSAVALGIFSVLIIARLRTGTASEAPPPTPPAVVVAAPAVPQPAVEPPSAAFGEVDVPEPEPKPPARPSRDLSHGANELSASKVFEEAKNRGDTAPADLDLSRRTLESKKPSKPATTRKPATPTRVARAGTSGGGDAAEAMALYEQGDLDGAIAAARSAGNSDLAAKIAAFKKAITAAKTALATKDGAGAIKHYGTALALDDELSKGWGKLGGQIRVELSKLFLIAGIQAKEKGDAAKAQTHLEKALKYDPENEKARQLLAKVKAGGASGGARSAADQAFGE